MKDNKSGSKKTIHPFIIFHFVLFVIFLVLAIYDTVRGDIRLDWKLAIATVVIFFDLVYVFRKRQKAGQKGEVPAWPRQVRHAGAVSSFLTG